LPLKFSFINAAPYEGLSEREAQKSIASFPPLGLLYLASTLEQKSIEVSVLDQPAQGLTLNETVRWVEKEQPDILGFSTFSSSGRTAALISTKVKEKNPNILVVFGNHYATFNAERILNKYPSVDIVACGEGEDIVTDLANVFNKEENLKNVSGITFRNNGKITSTEERPLIEDLDAIPFPDRKLIDVDYHSFIAAAKIAPKKFTSIVSSRGCVYRCRFCSCTSFARNKWRSRSIGNIMEELHLLTSEGYKQFIFVDDSFTLNPKRVINLCRRIRKEKIDMEWICEGRVNNCSFEMLQEIQKAGCRVLYLGIESANQRILDYYDKRITPQQSEATVKAARRAGIDIIVGSFILGAPDETKAEIQNTIEFAKRIPIDFPQFNILGIFPGTDMWNEFNAKGFINEKQDYWETGIAISKIYPTPVTHTECEQMVKQGLYDFVGRPSYILKQAGRTMKSPYRIEILINNIMRIGEIRKSLRAIA
jgi:anaerobic magnesium-protoporphyrin IX monomethyl ester cyclase